MRSIVRCGDAGLYAPAKGGQPSADPGSRRKQRAPVSEALFRREPPKHPLCMEIATFRGILRWRCRRRTWSSSASRMTPSTAATSMPSWSSSTLTLSSPLASRAPRGAIPSTTATTASANGGKTCSRSSPTSAARFWRCATRVTTASPPRAFAATASTAGHPWTRWCGRPGRRVTARRSGGGPSGARRRPSKPPGCEE